MTDRRYDVAIIGGGLVGLTLAWALADAGVSVVITDREDFQHQERPGYDGRASALSYGSTQIFRALGLWDDLAAVAQPIHDIRVADGHPERGISELFLHYDHRAVGTEPLGYIVENRELRTALHRRVRSHPRIRLQAPRRVTAVERTATRARVVFDDGDAVLAAVAVAADGRDSPTRTAAGIRCAQRAYGQSALVCTVAHERDHRGVAVELFFPGGPFAMLPMTDRRSNVVWSERTATARQIWALDDASFLDVLQRRFGDWLGAIRLDGPRFRWPLTALRAETYIAPRLALAGDAAHVIHPIAGQGYNMGVRDVAALAEALVDAHRLGLDIGAPDVLETYQRWRRFDNMALAAVCDGLLRLFSNDVTPLRRARDLGLALVNRAPPLKRALMRHAMGVVGALPRLACGAPL